MLEPTLAGPRVTLAPLLASHRDALLEAARDGELWKLKTTLPPGPETVDAYIAKALAGRAAGDTIPFVTQMEGRIVGSTRFWRIDWDNRIAEIGHTWISASWQRTFVNTEAKLLMLRYAFGEMACVRVQLMTDARNTQSRAAIARIGAVQEGILRHERIMPDGHKRDSVVFSILDHEWPEVETRLEAMLAR